MSAEEMAKNQVSYIFSMQCRVGCAVEILLLFCTTGS